MKEKFKDKFKKTGDNSLPLSVVMKTLDRVVADLDNLKSSYLNNNFLLLALVEHLLKNGVATNEELETEKQGVIKSYYGAIEDKYNSNFSVIPVNRKSQKGDHLSISFVGKHKEAMLKEFSSPWFFYVLGSGKLLFEADLVGKMPGENFQTSVRLPQDFPRKELANEVIQIDVEIIYVKSLVVGV